MIFFVFLTIGALHTAAAPAVRAAVKSELSYRSDTIIAFFFAANKNYDYAKVALASSNS